MARTATDLYDAKQRAWAEFSARERAIIRAAYPDTDGIGLYLHNWYICSRDTEVSARAAALRDSLNARWRKIRAWYTREYDRAQHRDHINRGESGRYLWCEHCKASRG